jgi:hypothetical protein
MNTIAAKRTLQMAIFFPELFGMRTERLLPALLDGHGLEYARSRSFG